MWVAGGLGRHGCSDAQGTYEERVLRGSEAWYDAEPLSLGLQIAQSRSYLYTLRPKVGIIYILGAMGYSGY